MQQRLARGSVVGPQRQAYARAGQTKSGAAHHRHGLIDRFQCLILDQQAVLLHVDIEQHGELVAAQAVGLARRGHAREQGLPEQPQQAVALGVALAVVDILEAVEVEDREGEGGARRLPSAASPRRPGPADDGLGGDAHGDHPPRRTGTRHRAETDVTKVTDGGDGTG